MSDDGAVRTADQRRKQFLFGSGRSYSAPPRKKWYRRNPLRRMGSQHSMLYDRVVSRRLVGAIAAWHDLHTRLLRLSSDKIFDDSSDRGTAEDTPGGSSFTPSSEEKLYSSQESLESGPDWKDEFENEQCLDEEESGNESDDTLDEIVEFNRKQRLNGKLSLSNPELTSIQLKQMFPELSEHWSYVTFVSPAFIFQF